MDTLTPARTLALSCSQTGGDALLHVAGELDAASSARLRRVLADLVRQPLSAIAIDLSAVTFMDSSGLGALLANRVTADRVGIEFRIVAPSTQVARVLHITGTFDRLVDPGSPEPAA